MLATAPPRAGSTLRAVTRMLRDNWALLRPRERVAAVGIAGCSLASSAVELAALSTTVPFIGFLIDPAALDRYPFIQAAAARFGLEDRHDLFLALGTGVIVSLIIGFGFRMTVHFLVERFSMRFTNRMSAETLHECLSAPYAWLRSQNGALLAQRITLDIPTMGQDMYRVVLDLIYGLFVLLVGTLAIFVVSSWQAIIVIIGIGAVGLAVLAFLNPLAARLAARRRDRTLTGNRLAVEIFAGRKLIKASQSERFFSDRYRSMFEPGNAAQMDLNLVGKAIPTSTLLISQVGILVLALVLVLSDFATGVLVAQLAFILLMLTRILPAVSSMTGSINALVNTEPFFRGFVSLRAELAPWRTRAAGDGGEISARGPFADWRRITLTAVDFGYGPEGDSHISGADISIERGQNIGIAGPSGAGKSTLVDLILGLLPPDHGHVSVDGRPLDDDSRSEWLAMTGYVPQDPYVIDDSLRRNVAFGIEDEDVDDRRIWSALEQAQLADVVRSWPDGLDTALGENGTRLSGGQRQRVAISRALYRGATILVLDEATNALDTEAEQTVTRMVRAIPGLTSIMIAHRMSALRECDRILLIVDGRMVADGSFDDLIKNNTLFSRLLLQTGQLTGHEPPTLRYESVG